MASIPSVANGRDISSESQTSQSPDNNGSLVELETKLEYDNSTPTDLSSLMGLVDPKNPLAGLEHIDVLDRDVEILVQSIGPQSDMSWAEAKDIIANMELYKLLRRPHDLRNYLRWKHFVEKKYSELDPETGERISGILMFILKERMNGRWGTKLPLSATAEGRQLFEDVSKDVIILSNDFPYNFENGVVHVVVWLRTPIPIEPIKQDTSNNTSSDVDSALKATTQLTHKSTTLINRFIKVNFIEGLQMAPENAIWFKNWAVLQSIPAMEHFHVLLLNPPMKKLEELYGTGGKQFDITI